MRRHLGSTLLAACLFCLLAPLSTARAGGPIASSQVLAGSLAGPTFSESWTFSGTSGQRVLIAAVTTSGAVITNISLRNPATTEVVNTTADRVDYQLLSTGTYTIVITDFGLNDAGTYNVSLLNVTAGPLTNGTDLNGGPIASAEVKTGQMNQTGDFDAFTFAGTAGDRVLFAALATSGAVNTTIYLYPPAGAAPQTNTGGGDRLDVQLAATGTYTVVVEDISLTQIGNYSVSLLNLTAGPLTSGPDPDGGNIVSADVKSAAFTTAPDFDAWRFTGTSGDRVLISSTITSAGSQITNVNMYPPGGGAPVVSTTADRIDYQLAATGTYTIVVEDFGLDHTGPYNVSLLNVTAGPLSNGADLNGGPIASAEVKTGQMNQTGDFDAFTFAGTTGDRVLLAALATSGTLNTTIYIYPPAGAAAQTNTGGGDRLDLQLAATGTYTVVIEDISLAQAGNYSICLLNLTAGPLTSGPDPDGGNIVSADVKSAAFTTAPDFDAWRFTGTSGDRVLISSTITSAGSQITNVNVYPPGGGAPVVSTTADRIDYQLTATGTYTIVVEDFGLDHTGPYNVSLLNITAGPLSNGSDLNGGPIASAEVKTGQMNQTGDFDAFTFAGTTGDRVLLAALATSGTLNTTIYIYPPAGAAPQANTGGGDRLDVQLTATGTYTVVVEDISLAQSGNYSVSLLNLTAGPLSSGPDPDGGNIVSAEVKSAAFTTAPDFDAWRFTGTAGNRVLISSTITSAGSQITNVNVYPPGGGPPVVSTTADRIDYQLAATGTYTIVVEDFGLDHTGPYNVSLLNVTAGPLSNGTDLNGGPIVSAEVKTGQMNQTGDFDAFTFSGTNGDRVLFAALATSGTLNTTIYIYPPAGAPPQTNTGGGDRLDVQLAATGTYTVVVEDISLAQSGNYSVSLLNLTAGPLTSVPDPDGGNIVSAEVRSAAFTTAPDFDAWRFTGTSGNRVLISAVNTSAGSQITNVIVYPPGGGVPVVSTTADRIDFQLAATGTYTIVVEDFGLDHTGPYNVSLLNVTAGPLSNGADLDGGPIASAEVKTGQMNQTGDFDAFTFAGTNGDRVLFAALMTSGTVNTTIYIYPPAGAPPQTNTGGGDRLDVQLAATGTYTVVVEDISLAQIGAYSVSLLNLTAGPLTSGPDPDGGTILSGQVKSATINTEPDFDAWRFTAAVGDTAKITAVVTSGPMNTMIYVYPPSGPPVVNTSADIVSYVLTGAGTHTIVIEDFALDDVGTYNLSLVIGTVSTATAEVAPLPTTLAFSRPWPNPARNAVALQLDIPVEHAGPAQAEVFDVVGRRVKTLLEGTLEPGRHALSWDLRDDQGNRVGSGAYFARLVVDGEIAVRRIVVLK